MEYNKDIAVNQLGYENSFSKIAVAKDDGDEFKVVNAENGEVVMTGKAQAPVLE